MTRSISVTEAARGFADVINRVLYRRESAVLIRGGKPVAKIIPIDEAAKTGSDLANLWAAFPHLSANEAASFAHDVESARNSLRPLASKWD